jgi:acetoin utilization deacetylase AcuC-like enzyme
MFESDPRLLFISLHQDNNYPLFSGWGGSWALPAAPHAPPGTYIADPSPMAAAPVPPAPVQRFAGPARLPCSYVTENGIGEGVGTTINVPLPPGR